MRAWRHAERATERAGLCAYCYAFCSLSLNSCRAFCTEPLHLCHLTLGTPLYHFLVPCAILQDPYHACFRGQPALLQALGCWCLACRLRAGLYSMALPSVGGEERRRRRRGCCSVCSHFSSLYFLCYACACGELPVCLCASQACPGELTCLGPTGVCSPLVLLLCILVGLPIHLCLMCVLQACDIFLLSSSFWRWPL